jgi:4-amino-4-deoxy-L-arabinose transferase-like glycosyltransferase
LGDDLAVTDSCLVADTRLDRVATIPGNSARAREWPALLAIVAAFAAGWLLVRPHVNVPVIDDWVYAWSVEHLLKTGRLQVLEISAFYPIAQILWGALFARLAGFSFVVLRGSTVALAVFGCWSVYLTLRELDCRRSTALLGALALAFDPTFFALSFSFMTDVPFVSFSTMALYWYVRAIRRSESFSVWVGCLCAMAAFLTRPIGIVVPLAFLPALLGSRDWRTMFRRSVMPLVITLGVMAALQVELPRALGVLDWASIRQDYLGWWFLVPLTDYLRWNVEVPFILAFPIAPLLLAYVVRWRHAAETVAVAIVLGIICRWGLGHVVMPLPEGQTWSLRDIAARSMLDGTVAASSWSLRATPFVELLGLLIVGALTVIVIRRCWHPVADRGRPSGRPDNRGERVVFALAGLQFVCINALWLYNDRYYVVFAPMLAIIGAQALERHRLGQAVAAGLLIIWAAIAISGTRDMLAFNGTCESVTEQLEASGVPSWDIDAGYSLDGWRLYAHPEHLPPGADRRSDVPFVTSNLPTHYSITNSPLPKSEILRIVPLDQASWQATHVLYLVRRK